MSTFAATVPAQELLADRALQAVPGSVTGIAVAVVAAGRLERARSRAVLTDAVHRDAGELPRHELQEVSGHGSVRPLGHGAG